MGGFVHLSGPGISIHPPRVGRDRVRAFNRFIEVYFNPPSPCGEGHFYNSIMANTVEISIHPPRVGRDVWGLGTWNII